MLIELTQGLHATIDDEDWPLVAGFKWYAKKASRGADKFYAATNARDPATGRTTTRYMHQLLCPNAIEVDHHDNVGTNNRRNNLRPCDQSRNQGNARPRADGKSRYRGVSPMPNGRFQARIGVAGKVRHLGVFATAEDAARAWDAAATAAFGEFAKLNHP